MDKYTAQEVAYKNGYEAGKRDAIKHGRWIMGVDEADYLYGECSVCGYVERDAFPCGRTPKFCPECGAKMDRKSEGGNK